VRTDPLDLSQYRHLWRTILPLLVLLLDRKVSLQIPSLLCGGVVASRGCWIVRRSVPQVDVIGVLDHFAVNFESTLFLAARKQTIFLIRVLHNQFRPSAVLRSNKRRCITPRLLQHTRIDRPVGGSPHQPSSQLRALSWSQQRQQLQSSVVL
jgi:hypothetical protein